MNQMETEHDRKRWKKYYNFNYVIYKCDLRQLSTASLNTRRRKRRRRQRQKSSDSMVDSVWNETVNKVIRMYEC